jgi:hypothetical protein
MVGTERRCSQGDGQHAGRDHVAPHYAKHVAEPHLQARPEDIQLGRAGNEANLLAALHLVNRPGPDCGLNVEIG